MNVKLDRFLMIAIMALVMSFGPAMAFGQKDGASVNPEVQEIAAVMLEATVEAVDYQKRSITLKGPGGRTVTMSLDDQVKNLDQVKPGDVVSIKYLETVTIKVLGKDQYVPDTMAVASGSAQPGQKPAGLVIAGVSAVFSIEAIDIANGLVTLKNSDGNIKTVMARNPDNLTRVEVGDRIMISYAEAIGVSVVDREKVVFRKTADNFIVMYDSSSSMGDRYAQTDMTEVEAEKEILRENFTTLPDLDWNAGIYTFTPNWSMKYFKPFLSMRTYNKKEFLGVLEELPAHPRGYTPLQGGLVGLGKEMEGLTGKTVVFLFTDGQYTNQSGFPSLGRAASEIAGKHDVCFKVISTSKDKKNYAAIKAIASVNECSEIVPFHELLGHPEWLTDALFNLDKDSSVVAKEQPTKEIVGYIMGKVLFDFDKSDIKSDGAKSLRDLSVFLKENPGVRVVLAGHTDNRGSKKYNIKLSQRRAESTRTYLVEKMRISADRITLSWFGKSEPVVANDTRAGRAKNRRVEAVVTGM